VSKTALSPVPIDLGRVWEYARPTAAAPIGGWSSTAYLTTLLNQVVFDIGVPTRAKAPLRDNDILFVGELVRRSSSELLTMRNLGKVTLHGIQRALAKHGLELSMDVGSWRPLPTSLTLPEPPPGPYDVVLDCEVFDTYRTCSWHARQYRLTRSNADEIHNYPYAYAYRERRYVSRWHEYNSWQELLNRINSARIRNVTNVRAWDPNRER
jgi:hypothetical protein